MKLVADSTTTTTLYLNGDARLGDRVIGTEEEFQPMLGDADIADYDVFAFSTLAELLTHLITSYPRIQTVEDATREFLGLTGSKLVTRIS
jgi:predicted component of type VI protein secretion system